MGWVTYKTKAWFFPVSHSIINKELTQFCIETPDVEIVSGLAVKVQRGLGDVDKTDIISPLSTDIEILLERGRVEMDLSSACPRVSISCPYVDVGNGNVVNIYNHFSGGSWLAVLSSVSHGMDNNGNLQSSFGLRRVM